MVKSSGYGPILSVAAGGILYGDGTTVTADTANFYFDDADNHVRVKGLATTALSPSAGEGRIGAATTTGLTLAGNGTTNDLSLKNRTGVTIFAVAANTTRTRAGTAANGADDGSGQLQVAGSISRTQRTLTTNTTLSASTDNVVFVDATAGSVTLTLPAANSWAANSQTRSSMLRIKRIDSSGNTVTIQRAGADTVEGATSVTLAALASKDFETNAVSAWWVC